MIAYDKNVHKIHEQFFLVATKHVTLDPPVPRSSMSDNLKIWGFVGLGAVATVGLVSVGAYYLGFKRGVRYSRSLKSYEMIDTDPLVKYILAHNIEDPTLSRLRAMSVTHAKGQMTSSVEVGKLLTILCQMLNVRKVIDIGVFTGCSAYAMALGMPADGSIIACDVKMEFAELGKPYWIDGGVSEKINLRIQPALTTLNELIDAGESGMFDLIFIDALKEEYPEYFNKGITLLRPGGVFVVDNALWKGKVADPSSIDSTTEAICKMNRIMRDDDRVNYVLLNICDGIGLAVKH